MPAPAQPKIYHISHFANLSAIVNSGGLLSDAAMIERGGPPANIGMPSIKSARLRMPVPCHPGTVVGDYVPFNFCPRSVMLNIIWYANHPNLTYRGGQEPILHLEANLNDAVEWADQNGRTWAFTLANARAVYTSFRASLDHLEDINWEAMAARDFRAQDVKECKQAEFLVQQSFPWHLVERIGVHSEGVAQQVANVLREVAHRPRVEIRRDWYY